MSRKHWLRNLLIVLESKSKSYYWTSLFQYQYIESIKMFLYKRKIHEKKCKIFLKRFISEYFSDLRLPT